MDAITPGSQFIQLLSYHRPSAQAWVRGGDAYPVISGIVNFYQTVYNGVLVEAEFFNLPYQSQNPTTFYGMHIHEYGDCSASFNRTGEHYNPTRQPHPKHAGDLPPLLGNQGYAWLSFYTTAFTVAQIKGKSVVIHSRRDDFTSQPSGDAGNKIACGDIRDYSFRV